MITFYIFCSLVYLFIGGLFNGMVGSTDDSDEVTTARILIWPIVLIIYIIKGIYVLFANCCIGLIDIINELF